MQSFDPRSITYPEPYQLQVLIKGTGNVPWDKTKIKTVKVVVPTGSDRANFAWAPRAYVVEDGKLTWIAKEPNQWPQGVTAAGTVRAH